MGGNEKIKVPHMGDLGGGQIGGFRGRDKTRKSLRMK
jgi:hypothetical protein